MKAPRSAPLYTPAKQAKIISGSAYERRKVWDQVIPLPEPDRLVLIDETGASTKKAQRYRRVLRGERCRALVPHRHRKTTIFADGLNLGDMTVP